MKNISWAGPEDFALNALRFAAHARSIAATKPAEPPPFLDFMAQRDETSKEMAALPCAPLHSISPAQLRHMRDWHAAESIKVKTKNPGLAAWHERSLRQLEEKTSLWGGLPH